MAPSSPIRNKKAKAKAKATDPAKIALGVFAVILLGCAVTAYDFYSDWVVKAYPPPPPINSEPIPDPALGEAGKVAKVVGDTFQFWMASEKDVFVKFYAPWCGHCKQLAPKFDVLAEELKDKFDTTAVAHMDLTANDLPPAVKEALNITAYPTLLLFKRGDRANPISFEGTREVEDMKKFLLAGGVLPAKSEAAPEPVLGVAGKVGVVVGSTFETWMDSEKDVFIKFYAPWCGHCKQLAPKFETLAQELKDKFDTLAVADMDLTANDIPAAYKAAVKVEGFPTLLLFKKGDRKNPVTFEGTREVSDLKTFLMK